ncbi:MAG TPA: DUF1549 domain-containing protein [bacterium]|nr:DUF1549 domain-containing protein [bacterium]
MSGGLATWGLDRRAGTPIIGRMVCVFALALVALLAPQGESPGGRSSAHWAYRPPVRRDPPVAAATPIDAFLRAKWPAVGLRATGPADRATLVRRLHLDLIGLPPTIAELEAFLGDREPGAYERLVDRLLASPHFGERWAVPWLDLARYGDTNGYNFDGARSIWPYRDWVIRAINDDLPFDRFTVEQLAGDLLPDADESSRIATGFHRNTMLNNEGGADPAEAHWERLIDRASTTATVWLGSTFRCAQCHDHKYDPLSQEEFYGLVAFFETSDEVDLERAADGARTMVLRERPGARPVTRLRIRGAYDNPGREVMAHLPKAYGPDLKDVSDSARRDRLTLARWLVHPDNPLTARVAANRVWMELFGSSLVDTPEDYGVSCARPLHLDLLDWLATEYVRLGWSRKRLIRTIVLSAAYRRDAAADEDSVARDPGNRYYARGTRFRLDAERIRDTWLAAAGLLSRKLYGKSVFPLQADTSGVTPMNKVDMRWPVSEGEDRWRRGLYTYWRRTAPFVQFDAFDAPSREICQVRRERSNTPLQALVGWNDPVPVAAAAALAERMRTAAGDERAKLTLGFRLCTSRAPSAIELKLLVEALRNEPCEFAWQRVAIVLLNLDETLCRG